jgi:rod shape-determining protein MreD
MTVSTPSRLTKLVRYRWLNAVITVGSVLGCLLMLPVRPPGMEILGIAPGWLLIWVVVWSVRRTAWEGAIAGLAIGLLQDGMTGAYPSHAVGFILVGVLTARIQKQRLIQEDFVSVALIVFGMAVIAQTAMALQISLHKLVYPDSVYPGLLAIWQQHQRIALSSAILSSLWAPVVYYPLNLWWEYYQRLTTSSNT